MNEVKMNDRAKMTVGLARPRDQRTDKGWCKQDSSPTSVVIQPSVASTALIESLITSAWKTVDCIYRTMFIYRAGNDMTLLVPQWRHAHSSRMVASKRRMYLIPRHRPSITSLLTRPLSTVCPSFAPSVSDINNHTMGGVEEVDCGSSSSTRSIQAT